MSAATLHNAIHDTIAEHVALDETTTPFDLLGVLEQVKHDILTAGDLEDDDAELDSDLDAA